MKGFVFSVKICSKIEPYLKRLGCHFSFSPVDKRATPWEESF